LQEGDLKSSPKVTTAFFTERVPPPWFSSRLSGNGEKKISGSKKTFEITKDLTDMQIDIIAYDDILMLVQVP